MRKYCLCVKAAYNTVKVGSYFSLKSKCSNLFGSNVVYKFTCSRDENISYLGETQRHLFKRISEHSDRKSDSPFLSLNFFLFLFSTTTNDFITVFIFVFLIIHFFDFVFLTLMFFFVEPFVYFVRLFVNIFAQFVLFATPNLNLKNKNMNMTKNVDVDVNVILIFIFSIINK